MAGITMLICVSLCWPLNNLSHNIKVFSSNLNPLYQVTGPCKSKTYFSNLIGCTDTDPGWCHFEGFKHCDIPDIRFGKCPLTCRACGGDSPKPVEKRSSKLSIINLYTGRYYFH